MLEHLYHHVLAIAADASQSCRCSISGHSS